MRQESPPSPFIFLRSFLRHSSNHFIYIPCLDVSSHLSALGNRRAISFPLMRSNSSVCYERGLCLCASRNRGMFGRSFLEEHAYVVLVAPCAVRPPAPSIMQRDNVRKRAFNARFVGNVCSTNTMMAHAARKGPRAPRLHSRAHFARTVSGICALCTSRRACEEGYGCGRGRLFRNSRAGLPHAPRTRCRSS